MNRKTAVVATVASIFAAVCGFFLGQRQTISTGPSRHSTADTQTTALGGNRFCVPAENDSFMFSGFTVGGKSYAFSDLPGEIKGKVIAGVEAAIEKRQSLYEEAALRALIASEKKVGTIFPSLDELLPNELTVTEEEARTYFNDNRKSFPKDLSFDQMQFSLINSLSNHKKMLALQSYKEKLAQNGFKIAGSQYCTTAESLGDLKVPYFGTKSSIPRVFWVTDLFCAECRRLWPTVSTRLAASGLSVAIGGKPDDALSKDMNLGLYCAREQGEQAALEFLKVGHGLPIQDRQDPGKVRYHVRETLPGKAQLQNNAYQTCLSSEEAASFVKKVAVYLAKNNIDTPPSILINGMLPIGENPSDILKKFDFNLGGTN